MLKKYRILKGGFLGSSIQKYFVMSIYSEEDRQKLKEYSKRVYDIDYLITEPIFISPNIQISQINGVSIGSFKRSFIGIL